MNAKLKMISKNTKMIHKVNMKVKNKVISHNKIKRIKK